MDNGQCPLDMVDLSKSKRQNVSNVPEIEEKNYIQLIAKILACFDLKRHYLRDNI